MNNMIRIRNLTKDFGDNRGIFDINLSVKEGEVFGLVGINGSGKTTMIRHLMGFLHPDKGQSSIKGRDCWKRAARIKKDVGYIPSEIAFPDVGTGTNFFHLQADYLNVKNRRKITHLAERFNLDPTAKLKRMSKGMKQKTAIVNAFMSDSKVLLLDEPTTGLDPLMQKVFTDLILEEKHKGKTIFMSSHMFDELETTCDRVAFLKEGHIIDVVEMSKIRGNEFVKEYKIAFLNDLDYRTFLDMDFNIIRKQNKFNQVTIHIPDDKLDYLFSVIHKMDIEYMTQIPQTLERYFNEKYNDDTEEIEND
jgi:ABC-2 type transport system ATP-binding protein